MIKYYDVQNYFFIKHHRQYMKTFALNKPLVYSNKRGEHFYNSFRGTLHDKGRPESFEQKVIDNAKKFWRHIFVVWASRNREHYLYLKKWLCCMIAGRKMMSILYAKSGQGT